MCVDDAQPTDIILYILRRSFGRNEPFNMNEYMRLTRQKGFSQTVAVVGINVIEPGFKVLTYKPAPLVHGASKPLTYAYFLGSNGKLCSHSFNDSSIVK